MYLLLYAKFPFYKDTEDELLDTICNKRPTFFENVSLEAIHLMSQMLDKDPVTRIAAAEIAYHPWVQEKPMATNRPSNIIDLMKMWREDIQVKYPQSVEKSIITDKVTLKYDILGFRISDSFFCEIDLAR